MASAGPTGAGARPPKAFTAQAGLAKLVNPAGLNSILARGKEKFGGTQAWKELMGCDVIFARSISHWYGIKGTTYYELTVALGQPLYKPVTDPELTEEEKAVMTAVQSRFAQSNSSVVLTRTLLNKTCELKDRIRELTDELGQTEVHLAREKVKAAALKLENRKLFVENQELKDQLEKERTKHGWKGLKTLCLWIFLATLIGGYITGSNAACTLVDVPSPMKVGYDTFKQMCIHKDSYLPDGAFDKESLALECSKQMDYMDCKEVITDSISGKTSFAGMLRDVFRVDEIVTAIRTVVRFAMDFSLAYPICVMFVLILTRNKKHAIISACCALVAKCCGLRLLPFTLVLTYAPSETAIAGCIYGLGYISIPLVTFLHWVGLVLKAILVPDDCYIGTRVSHALAWSIMLPMWIITQELMAFTEFPLELQIVTTVVVCTAGFGFRYLTGTVTITEPDGTVKKYKRIFNAKSAIGTISTVFFEKAKAIRGVIPSFPSKADNIVKIEVDVDGGSAGVGFRLGNYIYTAGHVVGEAKIAKITWKGLTSQAKVLGHIELPLFTDTLARLEIPKPFQQLPVFRLAKSSENDYVQMVCFDNQLQNVVTFSGWANIDGDYLNAPFETYAGTSGSPIINRDGRMLGVHFGSNAVVSQGFVITRLFATEPAVKQCKSDEDLADEIVRKVMGGIRISFASLTSELEKQRDELNALKQMVNDLIDTDLVALEKKKGKTKRTVRGQKHKTKAISKAAFMKTKVLTEEEYRRLEEEGFTKDEIKDIVDNLREQAWLDYQNQLDEEGDDDWYEQMEEDQRINDQIDQNIERDLEDRGEWYGQRKITFKQRAMLRFIQLGRQQQVATVSFPDGYEDRAEELYNKVVTTEDLPEGETSEAALSLPNKIVHQAGKRLNFKHVKIHPDKTFMKSGVTQIEEKPEGDIILKAKTTTLAPKEEPVIQQVEQQPQVEQQQQPQQPVVEEKKRTPPPKPQRKPKTGAKAKCLDCGETFVERQDFHVCKSKKLNEPPSGGYTPVPDHLRWNNWQIYMEPLDLRITVPENYPILGHIAIDKLVERKKKVNDPLLKMLEQPKCEGFTSTTWTRKAYTKSFEKFDYGDAVDFVQDYPELTAFADAAVLAEVGYMEGTHVIPIQETSKNMDSTPAFPKMLDFDSERDYLEAHGMKEYIDTQLGVQSGKPLWWCFLKNEILKEKKVSEDDIRIITCSDPVITRLGASFDSEQNERMKERTETHHAQVGWTPFFGGLDKRVRRITSCGRTQVLELDWTRFDGTIPVQLFQRMRELRKFFLTRRSRRRYGKLLDWYNAQLTDRITLLPTGEVTHVKKGNPSGQFSTTVDNNLVNEWLTAFEFGYQHLENHGIIPTVRDYRANVDFLCYGDDRLLAFNPSFVNYDPQVTIDMYKNIFGMWVKPENIKLFDSPTGSSFCGFTLVKPHGQWVGVVNVNKLLQSLKTPTRRLPDLESLWGKLVSLKIMCYHSDPEAVSYLSNQIRRVEEYARAEGIELPEVGPDFYRKIW
ncbi:non-structural polyprotein [Avian nephritis virus 1]|uniref:Non-structural polyprotein 1AB n=2 Tax=Avian nephritis virus 1 TaxID=336960 RepID=NS1AB_ANV1|nr:RecName: Full=Non-structural polyprotein 1AB; Contains: RecName: Full=VPg; Contains: RecName: Full=Protein p19; Contains: RecName: Full=Transmembrane protein 1A; Contains: RecName: Full=Serine protease p27; Short=p27; Contains: RecName: Full=Protein p20; Contains: RecName: Full=RNA-directed RNA polymerase p57; Short=p57 [Avian nephritis virus 1]BAA92848.1 non-structural polyprotein [Avian nephritis virus 1]